MSLDRAFFTVISIYVLIGIALLACPALQAETFRVIWDKGSGDHKLACIKEKVSGKPEFGYEHYACKSDDTQESLLIEATIEVSCDSENATVSIPYITSMNLRSDKSPYVLDGRIMRLREINQRLSHDYFQGTNYVKNKPITQKFPVDVYFYDGSTFLTQEGCGGQRMSNSYSSQCSKVVTSGPLQWTKFNDEQGTPFPVVTFMIPRTFLWKILKNRQSTSDCHDRGEGCGFEIDHIKMLLWRVDNPSVKLIALGDRVGRREQRTFQSYPLVFSMFGRARAWDGFSPSKDPRVPDVVYEDLNHLQDYYNSCQDPKVVPPPPPAPERPALDYSALNAQEYLKIMKLVDTVWDDYKDMTLEEYVDLP